MRRGQEQQVMEYRQHTIVVSTDHGKFKVEELFDLGMPLGGWKDTLGAAKHAVDQHIMASQRDVRRPVLIYDDRYGEAIEAKFKKGTLTSFSRVRHGSIQANVSFKGRSGFSQFSPTDVYEDTPANKSLADRVLEINRLIGELVKERKEILEKSMDRAEPPKSVTAE